MVTELQVSLNQWCLGILMGICSFFGVQELPALADPHWAIEQRWEQRPDGYHQLVISSETIQEECRSGRAKYLIFPQSYMARQEVYADNVRVYTNEMDREWYLKSFLNKPVISCDLVVSAKIVKFKILSYEKYFASIGTWPTVSTYYPKYQWGYTISYTVVAVLSAVFGLLFFTIGLLVEEKGYNILFLSTAIFLLMYSHFSEYFLVTHVHLSHQIAMISLLIISYVVICEKHFFVFSPKSYLLFAFLVFVESATSYSFPYVTQLYIIVNSALALLIILYQSSLKEEHFWKRIILFIVFVFGFKDLYESQIERQGFLHLSLLCLLLIVFMSYQLIIKIYEKNLKHEMEKESIVSDKRMIEKIRDINFKIKQIVHDMKSPITSLNFLLASEIIAKEKLHMPVKRLNVLVGNIFGSDTDYMADWYSLKVLSNCVIVVIEEKSYTKNVPIFHVEIKDGVEAFFDPELVKSLVAELIDNSIKNNDESILVKIVLRSLNNGKVELRYSDNGVGLVSAEKNILGITGYSRGGSGIGLSSLISRLKEIGANISFDVDHQGGFFCVVTFLQR